MLKYFYERIAATLISSGSVPVTHADILGAARNLASRQDCCEHAKQCISMRPGNALISAMSDVSRGMSRGRHKLG